MTKNKVIMGIIIALIICPLSYASELRNKAMISGSTETVTDSGYAQSQEDSIPYLDNYLRIFIVSTLYYGGTFSRVLKIIADDPNGIHSVVLMYMLPEDTEYRNQSMEVSDSITGEYQTTIHFDFYGGLFQYNVRYFANDTLGNEALTDEFIYRVFEFPGTTSDGFAAVHDTPDIIYQVGTTGNVLRWTLLYGLPGDSATYSVRKDGYPIEISPLSTSEIITNVDGLRIGSYLYEFSASDFFGGGYDNATVTVVEDLNTITQTNSTTSTTVTSTTTTDDIPPNLEFLPFLGGLTASILILILVLRRIKQK